MKNSKKRIFGILICFVMASIGLGLANLAVYDTVDASDSNSSIATKDFVSSVDEAKLVVVTEAPTTEPTTVPETTVAETTEPATEETTEEVVETEPEVVEDAQSEDENYEEEPAEQEEYNSGSYSSSWGGQKISPFNGRVEGPSGQETFYNMDMSGVISIMRSMGYSEEEYPYWIRDDGCKMFGDYIMVAAGLNVRPKGTILECSLGTAMVCDTGGFAYSDPYQLDIAVDWVVS